MGFGFGLDLGGFSYSAKVVFDPDGVLLAVVVEGAGGGGSYAGGFADLETGPEFE